MLNKYRLTGIAILLVIAGSFAWWWVEAGKGERRAEEIVAALRQSGWRVETGESSVTGAPMRLDFNFSAPSLGAADGRWRWSAEEAHIRRLIYRRDYLQIGVLGAQRLETPFGPVAFTTGSEAASLRFGAEGYGTDQLSRLSVVLSSLSAGALSAKRIEAHLGATPDKAPKTRKLYLGAHALKIGAAPAASVSLAGFAAFDRPLDRSGAGAPELVSIILPADEEGGALTIASGESAVVRFSGRLDREPGADLLTGWRGKLGFETDDAEAVIALLAEAGLLDADSAAALRGRIAASGRLAGVIEIDGETVSALDISPEAIPLRLK